MCVQTQLVVKNGVSTMIIEYLLMKSLFKAIAPKYPVLKYGIK